jgi:preprotein translocase subunit SecE
MATVEQIGGAGSGGGDRGIVAWWNNSRNFFTEVRNEMRRVTWPSRKEVYATTVVVLLTAAFFGVYLGGIDLALDRIFRWIYASF